MSMIPEVKCRRCGQMYPATRSTCPSCGTRRVTQSGRTPAPTPGTVKGTASYERAETNTKWQMIFGMILVVAVVLAVIVMVSTNLAGKDAASGPNNQVMVPSTPVDQEPVVPTVDVAPTAPPTPTPKIESISIMFNNVASNLKYGFGDKDPQYPGYAPTLKFGSDKKEETTIHVVPVVLPATIGVPVEAINWTSDDPDVLEVVKDENGEADITILGTKNGGVVITCEIYGVETKMRVYCVNS